MAKRMQDKESIAGMSWLVLLIIACWGGLVRYLIDVKQSKATWSLINALAQMVVSGFTGVIAGLVSIESGLSSLHPVTKRLNLHSALSVASCRILCLYRLRTYRLCPQSLCALSGRLQSMLNCVLF